MRDVFKVTIVFATVVSTMMSRASFGDENDEGLGAITVFGRGETRQVAELSAVDLAEALPGSSPLKVLSKLPGVNFNSADTTGSYEWGGRISIRGFSQNQLGFTLDDVPLGDMSYRNYNGLHISRAIASENLGRVVVSQGTGALEVASTSNLGGAVQFYSLDPSEDRSAFVAQTLGDDSFYRTFARLESGRIRDAVKVSLSFTGQGAEKWKGPGQQRHQQVNLKTVADLGESRLSAFVNYSDRKEADYMDLSYDSVARLGYDWDYFAPNWALANQIAQGVPVGNVTSQDDAYYSGSGLRRDTLVGATYDWHLNDAAGLKTTVYHHDQKGTGTWWTPYLPSPGGELISLRTLEFDIDRSGALTAFTFEAGIQTFNAGFWYESNDFRHAMRFYAQDGGPTSAYVRPSDPFYTRWYYKFQTDTTQFYLQDSLRLAESLTANIGFKSPRSKTSVKTLPGTDPAFNLQGSLTAKKSFLPQAGLNWRLNEQDEFFADVARNLAAFRAVVKGGASAFDTTQTGFDAVKDSIEPETSTTYEAGWRRVAAGLQTSITVYHVDFKDRLLAIQQGSAIAGNPSVLANVGDVRTNGVEAGVVWSPVEAIQWANSVSYNDSKYRDNFSDNGRVVNTAGKEVVNAPKVVAHTELQYKRSEFSAHLGGTYTGKRYYTYVNDNSAGAYSLWDAGASYNWETRGFLKNLTLQAGVNNLFDRRYYAFGDNPFVESDPAGTSYNLLAGAPRSIYAQLATSF